MSVNLRYPDAGVGSRQLQSFLRQMVDELNIALTQVETTAENAVVAAQSAGAGNGAPKSPQSTFNSIKSLIIKSAEIVNAYYDVISKRLEGEYVAQSDFGAYSEKTANEIEANSTAISQFYTNLQQILSDVEGLETSIIEVNAHIHTGLLYYDEKGAPVYGLEIGQRTQLDGTEVFNKFARFTSEKLSFYDSNDNEVAYISDKKLYITHVEIRGSLRMGGFVDTVLSDGSVVTKWIGG